MFWGKMGAKMVILLMTVIIIHYSLLAEALNSESNRRQQLAVDDRIDWEESIDDDTAELLWENCGAELVSSMEYCQDLQYCDSGTTLIGKERLLKAIDIEDPHVKKTVLDCLKTKQITLSKSRKDKLPEKWYTEYLLSSLNKPNDAPKRRRLAETVSPATVAVVVIVTAIVTLCVAGVSFYCYAKKKGLAAIKKDEKPLPNKKSTSGVFKKLLKPKSKHKNTENESNGQTDANVSVDSGLQMKASLDPPVEPPTPKVKQHTLKPRAIRAESSLHPTKKTESVIRSPVGGKDSAHQLPPVTGGSPASSPAATPRSPATAPPAPPKPPPPAPKPPPPAPPIPGRNSVGAPPPPRWSGASIRALHHTDSTNASKTKLKPFFWDKVLANPDKQMVWDKINQGSFQFNEETIESLFGYQAPHGKNKDHDTKNTPPKEPQMPFIQVIDTKKAQNLSILLKALNVTIEEVSAALIEGNELPIEIVQTLLKMAPTNEEEMSLRVYGGDLSRLGPAERFLKKLVEIPYAFRRLESLLFMCTLQDEEANIKESFETLEAACTELKKSRLFSKLLEAVLKTGNRMNVGTFRGSATAFKLDTLLKLSDVKGIDGKTTLLHFVVQEIMRGEGTRVARAAKDGNTSIHIIKTEDLLLEPSKEEADEHYCRLGLKVVSGLSSELENVTQAAFIDADVLSNSVTKLANGLVKAQESLTTDMKSLEEQSEDAEVDEFWLILSTFVKTAEKDISWMVEEEKRIMALVKSTVDYFHGNVGKDEGLRLFSVVRDFLIILEKVCKEIEAAPIKPLKKKDGVSLELLENDDLQTGVKKDDGGPEKEA
ncbi:formin-like protein 5 [Bidens hawaiensis]|uniref:formin-like protein 5 n=1 Tax=Bidens hawaiensis TaxID=980011 RepID=UPI0040493EB2